MSPRLKPLGSSIPDDAVIVPPPSTISSLVPLSSTPTLPPGLSIYCIRHRYRFMTEWQSALDAGMTSAEARLYAELTIKDLVVKGELARSIPDPLVPDDSGAESILPPNPKHAPVKIKLKPKAYKVVDGHLVDETPRADLPSDSRNGTTPAAPESNPTTKCPICYATDPCHLAWCGYAESEMAQGSLPLGPAPAVAPVTEVAAPKAPHFSFVKPGTNKALGPYEEWWLKNGGKGSYADWRSAVYD